MIRLVIYIPGRATVRGSPIVFLLGREGPGDVQGVNLPDGHHCKQDDTSV